MVLIRPHFRFADVQFDRATALGLAVVVTTLGLLVLSLPNSDPGPMLRWVAAPAEPIEAVLRPRNDPPPAPPAPPLPAVPVRPVLQPIIEQAALAKPPAAPAPPAATHSTAATTPPLPATGPALDTPAATTEASVDYDQAPPPPYPPSALRRSQQGTVLLRVRVGEDGRVLAVVVERGSGVRELDRAAERQVARLWRFHPAQQDGRAVEAWVRVPIRFRLAGG